MGEFFVFKFAYAFFFLIGLFFIENGKNRIDEKVAVLTDFLNRCACDNDGASKVKKLK